MGRYKVNQTTGELTLLNPSMDDIPIFQGVSGSIASVSGLVPEAHSGDENKFLKGDGTWGEGGGGEANDNFRGTWEDWNNLSPSEQAQYNTRDIIGDFNGQPVDDELSTSSMNPIQNKAVANPIEAMVNLYGSKNLCKYPYASTTKVYNGITWTDNGDGSITASGTATADSPFNMWAATLGFVLPKGDYILSGCPENGSESTYYLYLSDGNTGHIIEGVYDIGDGVSFTVPQDNLELLVRLAVKSGTAISTPITFYPMIRDARITDNTFVPYAMTNQELTKVIQTGKDKTIHSETGIVLTGNGNDEGYANINYTVSSAISANTQANITNFSTDKTFYGSINLKVVNSGGTVYGMANGFLITSGDKCYVQVISPIQISVNSKLIGGGVFIYK